MSNLDAVSSSHPLKRRRTEDDAPNDTSAPEPSKNTRFWFEDGNIVLQAEDTQFRVHRGVIARHSVVFHDMLLVAYPETGSVDGCPVVSLTDDAAHDWIHVLGIIYDNEILYQTSILLNVPLLGAMLRLGRKYQFDKLYTSALVRLKKDIPTTLEGWDKAMRSIWDIRYSDSLDLLNLLEEFGIQTLLPTVYYHCVSKYDVDDIMDGVRRNDGSVARLSNASAKKLLNARMDLASFVERYKVNAVISSAQSEEDAENPSTICKPCNELQAAFFVFHNLKNSFPFVLPRSSDLFPPDSELPQFCAPCKKLVCTFLDSHRQYLWGLLPSFFAFPSWRELSDTPYYTPNQPS